jgi:hypothetical protein
MNPYQLHPHSQLCPSAVAGIVSAVLALGLAIFGVYSPWGALRFPVEQKLTGGLALLGYGGTFVVPIVLGLLGTLLGSHAVRVTAHSEGKLHGEGLGVFSIMIGVFAAIIGGVCTFAALIWPNL